MPNSEDSVNELNRLAKDSAESAPIMAIYLAHKAIKMAREIDYPKGEADGLTRIALGYQYQAKTDSAVYFFEKSLTFRRKHNLDIGGIAATISRLGDVYDSEGLYMKALVQRRDAVQKREEEGKPDRIARVYNKLATTFKLIAERNNRVGLEHEGNEPDSSIYYFRKALPLWSMAKNEHEYANTCNMLATVYRTNHDYDSALVFLDQAEKILKDVEAPDFLLDTYLRKGRLYDDLKNHEEAFDYHTKAFELAKILKDTLSQFAVLINLGENQFLQQKFTEALSYYQKAEKLSLSKSFQKMPTLLKILNTNLANTCDSLGRTGEALNFLREASDLAEKISRSEDRGRFQDAKDKVEISNDLDKVKQERKTLVNGMIGAGICLSILIIIGIYIQIQRNKYQKLLREKREDELLAEIEDSKQKLLTKQNENKDKVLAKVGRELHDDVGATLVAVRREMESFKNIIKTLDEGTEIRYSGIFDMVNKAYTDLRRVSKDMKQNSLDGGLFSALHEMVGKVNSLDDGLFIKLYLENPTSISLDSKIEINAYRIIQEAINNIVKHAKAEEVILQVLLANDCLSITIEDDGIGFDSRAEADGIGLKNIHDRVEDLKGTLTIDSVKGKGTSIFVEIPVTIQSKN
ncbi:MAG: sensor histidine kinase [Bacteroidetes bacterium]|nr:sensor histidine kinase [Bacteroidota bacterium]